MFSSGCSLKYSKKRDQWENSTRSFRIEGKHFTAWSYGEIIGEWLGKKYYLVNLHRFSITTSGHQSQLSGFLDGKIPKNKIRYVDIRTLNYGIIYEDLERTAINIAYVEENYKGKLKKFKQEIEERDKKDREDKNRQNRIKKIRNFDFKSRKGFEKAIKDLGITPNKARGSFEVIKLLDMGYSWEEIQKEWLVDGFGIGFVEWAKLKQKNIDAKKYFLDPGFIPFHDWIDVKKMGLEKEAKKLVKKPKPEIYFGIYEDLDHIDIKDLITIERKTDGYYGEVTEIIRDYIAKKKMVDLI